MKKIIYDFGSNNGDDIPYYLKKADLVVAVEADPRLSRIIQDHYAAAIFRGNLVVESCVLNCEKGDKVAEFYIHKSHHIFSQFPRPEASLIDEFVKVFLPSKTPAEIVKKYGKPFYIKIDIEHYDHIVLAHLFENRIFPNYLSAEFHSREVVKLIVECGKYKAFKVVDGYSVPSEYANLSFEDVSGKQNTFSFPHHSAGPFGNDVKGDWMSAEKLISHLDLVGTGWKDIHASRVDLPST